MMVHPDAQRQLAIAKVWQKRQRYEQAIAGFKKTLELDPEMAHAYLGLGKILFEQGRYAEALEVCRKGLAVCPNGAELHKGFLNALEEQSALEACFQSYALTRKDTKHLHLNGEEIICLSVVRNEKIRLPYFLSFYRALGIDVFFFVDNQSNDGTMEYLLQQSDVYVWHSDLSFNKANFGSAWFEILLRAYGKGHWCLTVDADELLFFPGSETTSIHRLCEQLDGDRKRAFKAIHLDMYSGKPINQTVYSMGTNFLDVCPYFDRQFYHSKFDGGGPFKNQTSYFGGVRERVFGKDGQYYLSKVPLLKYDTDMVLAGGQHWTNLPQDLISTESGALLHFKFFSTFHQYVEQEASRGEHYGKGMQYKHYHDRVKYDPCLSFYDPQHSVKFVDSRQLVDMAIMNSYYGCMENGHDNHDHSFPSIHPAPSLVRRPSWSIMITAYTRINCIEKALQSVLAQVNDPNDFQVELVIDGEPSETQEAIARVVKSLAGNQVEVYRTNASLGQPEVFNRCIDNARGKWIHILHDDDWVHDGFYHALQTGFQTAPDSGAAFCRHIFVNEHDQPLRTSWLERETPGLLEHWLERIWVMCRMQTPSIAVQRRTYEHVGGYSNAVGSAWDWDMWKRISANYTMWYEPKPLAAFREHTETESTHLIYSGKQIQDSRKSIDLAESYLPKAVAKDLTKRARIHYARYALDIARRQLQNDDLVAAFANIREGTRCSRSPRIQQELLRLLQQH
jgi:glycosyltransferase involved in cell wall biosynthesis